MFKALVASIALFSFVGCGGGPGSTTPTNTVQVTAPKTKVLGSAILNMSVQAPGPVTWKCSEGTIDSTGKWTAPWNSVNQTGQVTITATLTSDNTIRDSKSVIVYNPEELMQEIFVDYRLFPEYTYVTNIRVHDFAFPEKSIQFGHVNYNSDLQALLLTSPTLTWTVERQDPVTDIWKKVSQTSNPPGVRFESYPLNVKTYYKFTVSIFDPATQAKPYTYSEICSHLSIDPW